MHVQAKIVELNLLLETQPEQEIVMIPETADRRIVFVVHGRNDDAKNALFVFYAPSISAQSNGRKPLQ
jgi:hypothetical protein